MRVHTKQKNALLGVVVFALFLPVLLGIPVLAEEEPAYIYVTVANADGTLVLAQAAIPLRDADGDGALTVHDALLCAHDAGYAGGASAGYAAEQTEGGLSATLLWGAPTDGYGCYINHVPTDDLLSPVQEEDQVYAFVSADPEILYCYFDVSRASVAGEEPLTLTLASVGYDGDGEVIVSPVADAVIRIDGKNTAFSTDAEGRVTLQFDGSGSCVISAWKDGVALMPPVCTVAVSGEDPAAGDRSALRWVLLSVAALAVLVFAIRRRRR